MNKKRVTITVTAIVPALLLIASVLFILWRKGAFGHVAVTDIAGFDSPDGSYCITYQQIGDPEWPFGDTAVRLTLYDIRGQRKNSVDTFISDDGAIADESNIKTIEWMDDGVKVILQASEMQDKEIKIAFHT